MADSFSHPSARLGTRRFWSTRPKLGAVLVSVGCIILGFVTMGLALFPLNPVQGEIFDGAGSALSSSMIFVGIVMCNVVAWAPGTRLWSACCITLGSLTLLGLPATAIALVRTGERRSLGSDAAAALTTVAGVTGVTALMCWVVEVTHPASALMWAGAFSAALSVGCLLWGRVRGTRAALLVSLREQALAAERVAAAEQHGRASEVARALAEERSIFAEERSALARDMHDGISHRLSVVALHAGAMSSREDLSPAQLRAAALTVRDAAEGTGVMLREALTALRGISEGAGSSGSARTLSLARLDSAAIASVPSATSATSATSAPSAPPTASATSLAARVAAAQGQGLHVALRWWGLTQDDLDRVPARASALAHITDETLINAIKYAPGQPLAIDVSIQHGQLRLLARNPLPAQRPAHAIGTGFGLIGLAERAALLGGGAKCGATVDAHFQVDVWIPWS